MVDKIYNLLIQSKDSGEIIVPTFRGQQGNPVLFSISILLTGESGNKLVNFGDYNAHSIGIVLLWLAAFLTLYTGYDYIKKGIDHAID